MRDDHIGEDAELHALGELDELEAARVEHHVRSCDECARRLGDAEATVLQLIESGDVPVAPCPPLDRRVRFEPPATPTRAWIAAVAAAYVLGLLPWGITMTQHSNGSSSQSAVDAMLVGHFAHAPLLPLAAGAPSAKVIYAREGGWIYVLAAAGTSSLDVATVKVRPARTSWLRSRHPGVTRAVFVNVPGRVDAVELLENGKPISAAHIAYAP